MSHLQDDAVAALAVAVRLTSLDLSGCLSLSDAGALHTCVEDRHSILAIHTRPGDPKNALHL